MTVSMTVSRLALLGVSWLAFLGIAACAAGPGPGSAPQACDGQRYLEVRNALAGAVDVYAYASRAGGRPHFLGTVSPGTEHLAVFEPLGFVYAEREGRRVSARRGAVGPVSFAYVCERPSSGAARRRADGGRVQAPSAG